MSLSVNIEDGDGGPLVRVTPFGQLVVAPLQFSIPIEVDLDDITLAFNFIEPQAGKVIIITDIIAFADNSVSNVAPADIEIYQASEPDTLTVDSSILKPKLVRAGSFSGTGLNLIVPSGKFVNAKTSDATIALTIMFYRAPAGAI